MLSSVAPLHEHEVILRTVRRHWLPVVVAAVVLGALFLFLVLAILWGVAYALTVPLPGMSDTHVVALGMFAVALFGLVLWMKFFALWSDHWLDVWIVTDRRLIDVEQHGFFTREVSSFPLERIQDVNYEVRGIIATWLKFGNVRIQTASISDDFIMTQVPHPDEIKDLLIQTITASKHEAEALVRDAPKEYGEQAA